MNQFSKNILVSVVIPTFNQGGFIKNCLDSILMQTHVNIEIIIQDSLSNDNTEEICKEYTNKDKRISYHREKDTGQSNAINRGLKKSNGILWTWLCSDDRFNSRESIEKLVEAFYLVADYDKSYVGVYGDSFLIDESGNYLEEEYFSLKKNLEDIDFKYIWPLSQPSSLLLKSSVVSVGGVREDLYLGMDLDLFLKLLKDGKKLLYVPFPIADNRLQENAKSVKYKAQTAWNCIALIQDHLGTIGRIPESTFQIELVNNIADTFFQRKDLNYFEEVFCRLGHYEKLSGRSFAELSAISETDAITELRKSNLELGRIQSLNAEIKNEAIINYVLLRELILTSLSQQRRIQKLEEDFDYVNNIMKLNSVVSYLILHFESGDIEYIIKSVSINTENFSISFNFTKTQSEKKMKLIHWIPMQNVYGKILLESFSIAQLKKSLIEIPCEKLAHNGNYIKEGWIEFLRTPGIFEIPVHDNISSIQVMGKWMKYEYQAVGEFIFKQAQAQTEAVRNSASFKLGYFILHPYILPKKIFKILSRFL